VPINKKSGPVRAKEAEDTAGDGAAGAAMAKKTATRAKTPTKAKSPARVKVPAAAKAGTKSRPSGGKSSPGGVAGEPDPAKLAAARMASLRKIVIEALDDMKALEVKVLDVRGLTDVADTMVIASGTSDRHVRSVAKNVVEKTKAAGFRPHGVEGQQDSDWVLIDLHDMIVHVMLPRTREFYGLEKLWDLTVTKRAARA